SFSFRPAEVEFCDGESASLTLESSEIGFNYFLYRDGSPISGIPSSGNGLPLVYNVTEKGVYSIRAQSNSNSCEQWMDGEPNVIVNLRPDPIATSDKPSYCEGETIELYGGPDLMTHYSWKFPDGTTVEEKNPIITSADRGLHNGTYTLTVVSPKGCTNSKTHDITVNENPAVTLPADFEACEASALTIAANVTGGT